MARDVRVRFIIDASDVQRATGQTDTSLNKIRASFNRTDKSVKATSSAFAGFGKNLLVGFGIVGGAAAVTSALRGVVEAGQVFQKSISELSAITGATGDDLDFLSDRAKLLGRTTTLSASEVAEGFKLIASAKPDLLESGAALAQVTEDAITLSEAAGIQLSQAAEALGGSLNQFQLEAEESSRIINVLAAGSQKGASEIPELTQALKTAGTVAAGANLSFETTIASIETLAEVNIKGAEAGTALRNVILRLQKQGVDQLDPSVVGLTTALRNLNAQELTTVELIKIFGTENLAAGQALLARTDRTDELEASITATNIAEQQAIINTDNLEGKTLALSSAMEGLQIALSDGVIPGLEDGVGFFATYINVVTDAIEATNKFADNTGRVLGGIFETNNAVLEDLEGATVQQIEDRVRQENNILNGLLEANTGALDTINDIASLGINEARQRTAIQEQEVFIAKLIKLRDEALALAQGQGGAASNDSGAEEAAARARKLAEEAEKISKEEIKRRKDAAREAERLAKDQQRSFESLRGSLDPAGQATRDLAKAQEILNKQFELGKISAQELEVLLVSAEDRRQKTLDSLNKTVEKTAELSDEEQRLMSLLEDIRGPQENFAEAFRDLNKLLAQGKIGLEEFQSAAEQLRLAQLQGSQDVASGFERGFIVAGQQLNDFASLSEGIVTKTFRGLEDGIVQFARTGKVNFNDLANSIIDDLIRIEARRALAAIFTSPETGSQAVGGGGVGGLAATATSFLTSFGDGGVQNTPTISRIAEKGPEAIIPLTGGSVPVQLKGGAGRQVIVQNTFNFPGADVDTFRRSQGDVARRAAITMNTAIQKSG